MEEVKPNEEVAEEEAVEVAAEAEEEVAEEASAEEAPAEEAEEKADEPAEEEAEEEETPEETAEKMGSIISEKINEVLTRRLKDSDSKKKKALAGGVKMADPEVKIYTSSKGRDIKLKKSEVEVLGKYFKAFLSKNYAAAERWLQKAEPLNLTTNADGGFLVPTILSNILIPLLDDEATVRPRASVVMVTGGQLDISNIATKPIASWSGREQLTEDKATSSLTFGSNSLTPYTLACIVPYTKQLLNSSPFNIVRILTQNMVEAITIAEERAFTIGNGVGQPTGFTTYGFGAINAGGALAFTHLNTAFFRLGTQYRKGATWLMNSRTAELVYNLVDGNNAPIVKEFQDGTMRFRGKPIVENNFISEDDIYLVDLSYYYIGDKPGGMAIDIADQAIVGKDSSGNDLNLFMRNMQAIRVERETDGEMTRLQAGYVVNNVR